MSNLTGNERKKYVRNMFGRIAYRYDLLNRLMTFWQDIQWRKILVRELGLGSAPIVLDIGCGTGDLAREIRKQHQDAFVIAADLTYEMVHLGSKATEDERIQWLIADAQNLPFKNEKFDAAVSGYLLRNVPDIDRTISEHNRVLKDRAMMASLDTSPPENNILKPIIIFYLKYGIPLLGRIIAGDSSAYTYLPDSTRQFLTAENLAEKIREGSFSQVRYIKKMFRTMALHWGKKESAEKNP